MICINTYSFKIINMEGNVADEFILQEKSGNHGTLFNKSHVLMDTDFQRCAKKFDNLLNQSKEMVKLGFFKEVIEA